jgi:exodeoxyribonuclease VII small subunit
MSEELKLTYEQAYTELCQIAESLENDSIGIDEMAEHVRRATQLVEYCQLKLTTAQEDINKVIASFQEKREL